MDWVGGCGVVDWLGLVWVVVVVGVVFVVRRGCCVCVCLEGIVDVGWCGVWFKRNVGWVEVGLWWGGCLVVYLEFWGLVSGVLWV